MTRDAQDTAARILDAAEEVFADAGLAGARVNAIADAAGVNKAMLYYYFDSKDGLYTAVLERVFGEILAVAESMLGAVDEENVGAFLAGYRAVLRSHPHFVRLLVRELADGGERVVAVLGPRLAATLGHAGGGLAQAQAAGRLNPDVEPRVALPVLVAPFVLFALAHPLLSAATGESRDALRARYDATAEAILLHGLIAPEGP